MTFGDTANEKIRPPPLPVWWLDIRGSAVVFPEKGRSRVAITCRLVLTYLFSGYSGANKMPSSDGGL